MSNKMIRATAKDGSVKIIAATTTEMINKMIKIHNTSSVASATLGRLITSAALMSSNLKSEKEALTLKINGGGPAGNVVAVAYPNGDVKGYIGNPTVELPPNAVGKLDVGGAVGKNGSLVIIRDLGLKEPYVGQVPIYTGEVGDDLAYYFTTSEQTPSAVGVGVLVEPDLSCSAAGGFIIQMMPDADPLLADLITYRLEDLPPITTLIKEGKTIEEILEEIFEDMDLKILEETTVDYNCNCTRDRVKQALVSIGLKDLEEIYNENKVENVQCHYCNTNYSFTPEDIKELIEEAK
ncbi:Hsp33 family molecular chaperone HslO [Clostridium cellulovorans]|uniref:33 kDa chaperonin n=1 Tax=Clostridium cellulovorans (strain ATCC 35296 / DSM 3052 / OCM 3 / 743B) TaxID=573061 RepID=D9SLZ8_CLOC7|nr:Hsp33 family molecular chaperone HslO [Clostridium cellulovorans]ADL51729.1 Hsp33 protein [Clostridium cellulovorans 743B]